MEVQVVFVPTDHHTYTDPNTPETPHFHSPKRAVASALLLPMIRISESGPRHARRLLFRRNLK